ncbi:MAG: hypothetical protein J7K47_01205 [Thermoplasmata archaeon]|nr:hypothetical protein [Thermoplasmata archaeon]
MEEIRFPEPDQVLKEKPSLKKYLRYFLFFGPGAIIASVTIGQGQLILGPQIGAWAQDRLLWIITLSFGSYFIAYVAIRFTLISGINLVDLFALKLKGALNWFFIALIIIFIPMFAATIITTLGISLQWIFGFDSSLVVVWGTYFGILAVMFVILWRYKIIEYTQAFFVVVLAAGAVASMVSSVMAGQLNILKAIPHFFTIGDIPSYPSWVPESISGKPIFLTILGYLGTLTVTIITVVGYSGWIKVKKWGIFKKRGDANKLSEKLFERFKEKGRIDYLPEDKKEIRKAKLLVTPALVDLMLAYIIVAIVSAAYMLGGYAWLGRAHLIPTDANPLEAQAEIFRNIAKSMSNWLVPLFKISLFFALFGTIYAGFEAASRMLYETMKGVVPKIRKIEYKQFAFYVFAYLFLIGIPLAVAIFTRILSLLTILGLTLLVIGVIGVIIYGAGALYYTQKVLPEPYRLGKAGMAIAILSLIFMAIPFIFIFR